MDFTSEDDLHRLLYCAHIVGKADDAPAYETFATAIRINKNVYAQAIAALVQYNNVAAQFTQVLKKVDSEPSETTETTLGDAVARLVVVGGIDPHYAMREMSIEDMLLYVKALDDKQRQEAESSRLWTYIQVAPHIDQKKTPSPQKLYPFPWEVELMKAKAVEIAEQNKEEFEKFMRTGATDKK